ncbi:precorrin-8X methylmutase CbiC/CobH [Calothrix sp. NIES-4101]|nr:precorrin-8X methylmutase CbiC/CobH [Calothrix sp. NIES-4101]
MNTKCLTIKELTDVVGSGITPRMVRHYHQLGLLPEVMRSHGNYRLYTERDIRRLQRIVALKQQGFQLNHIRQLLDAEPENDDNPTLTAHLQRQYRVVMQQIAQLRQTASALEGLLGRDKHCQIVQADVLAQLKLIEVETQSGLEGLQELWAGLDTEVHAHPENFQESLQGLLPDISHLSEIEQDLISKLVLACGDVSLVGFIRFGNNALATSRAALKSGCQMIADISSVAAAFDDTRLTHLNCRIDTFIDNPHITTAIEAEQEFWQQKKWRDKLQEIPANSILVIGYAPAILLSICAAIKQQQIPKPALVIGMPIGFSHAPAAKRQLMHSGIPFITIEGTLGGGLLAATVLNTLTEWIIEKPDCHCYLK